MKEDEKKFFRTCLKFCSINTKEYGTIVLNEYFDYVEMKFMTEDKSFLKTLSPRDVIKICEEFIHPKRAVYLLSKWSDKGFYDYGVTLDLGWFDETEFFGEYLEIYSSVKKESD